MANVPWKKIIMRDCETSFQKRDHDENLFSSTCVTHCLFDHWVPGLVLSGGLKCTIAIFIARIFVVNSDLFIALVVVSMGRNQEAKDHRVSCLVTSLKPTTFIQETHGNAGAECHEESLKSESTPRHRIQAIALVFVV